MHVIPQPDEMFFCLKKLRKYSQIRPILQMYSQERFCTYFTTLRWCFHFRQAPAGLPVQKTYKYDPGYTFVKLAQNDYTFVIFSFCFCSKTQKFIPLILLHHHHHLSFKHPEK